MSQVVVMVEEQSIGIVIQALAEKLNLSERVKVISHEGKSDLEASFPRKLRGWSIALSPKFVICRDNDGGNCTDLKARLRQMVPAESSHPVKIRIVVQELESWYLGDLQAVESAGLIGSGRSTKLSNGKFKKPETFTNAKQEFLKLVNETGQLKLARRIAPHMSLETNKCHSFNMLVEALRWAGTP